jgi:hypothetical protein
VEDLRIALVVASARYLVHPNLKRGRFQLTFTARKTIMAVNKTIGDNARKGAVKKDHGRSESYGHYPHASASLPQRQINEHRS